LGAPLHDVVNLSDSTRVAEILGQVSLPGIAQGAGRSYGDACLNPGGSLLQTGGMDHFIRFDESTGRLVCEAGVLLLDIQRLFVPRGWILPVTPGTQMVTVGGAIANDVHGKNHHMRGSFGNHVQAIRLVRTDGTVVSCGPDLKPDWFAATVGGLGLTGIIVEAEIQLSRVPGPWLDTETIAYASLDEFFELAASSEANWEHTVSWVDCSPAGQGRGLFMRANPAATGARRPPSKAHLTMRLTPPVSLVNRWSLRPFNLAYYNLKKKAAGPRRAYYESFFYPLDNLHDWNRMYGPSGFYQYQCVVPGVAGPGAIHALLAEVARSGEGSFLTVLKTFGEVRSVGLMSFPQPGVTLALDFPNRGRATRELFERLDGIVREANGRLYLAKDARMPRDLFEAGYPGLEEFLKYRDPGLSSGLSRRLMGS
jgi:FAD/FMN-containing dehydrogenase